MRIYMGRVDSQDQINRNRKLESFEPKGTF